MRIGIFVLVLAGVQLVLSSSIDRISDIENQSSPTMDEKSADEEIIYGVAEVSNDELVSVKEEDEEDSDNEPHFDPSSFDPGALTFDEIYYQRELARRQVLPQIESEHEDIVGRKTRTFINPAIPEEQLKSINPPRRVKYYENTRQQRLRIPRRRKPFTPIDQLLNFLGVVEMSPEHEAKVGLKRTVCLASAVAAGVIVVGLIYAGIIKT